MKPPATLALALLSSAAAVADETQMHLAKNRIEPRSVQPVQICLAGEVSSGREFRHAINSLLEFVLEPGWNISIVPTKPDGDCKEFASVVNGPYHAHRQLEIDTRYGWTAQDEVDVSPRTFNFVTNCADYRTESKRLGIVLWGYGATGREYQEALRKLGSSPLGTGRFWI